jgi:hypothetical protein
MVAAVAAAGVLMVGCGDSDPGASSTQAAPATTSPAEPIRCPSEGAGGFDTSELVGLSEAAAEARAKQDGCTIRVVERDGEPLPATMDFSPDRVNVAVTDDEVTAVKGVG